MPPGRELVGPSSMTETWQPNERASRAGGGCELAGASAVMPAARRAPGRDVKMPLLLAPLAARPIAAIAATPHITDPRQALLDVAAVEVARQITSTWVATTHVAVATLRGERAHTRLKAPMGNSAQRQPAVEHAQALEQAIPANGPMAQLRATARTRVLSVGAAEAAAGTLPSHAS